MRKPALNSLYMFDAAARYENFRLAAEELHLTQGAVAQQVRKLESELGVKLFRRLARGLELTEAGSVYHASIRQALSIIAKATDKISPDNTTIAISVTPSLAAKWLVKKLASFNKLHPQIKVSTLASEKLVDFDIDSADLAIRQGQPPFGKNLQYSLLAPENLCAVCHPRYARKIQPIRNLSKFLELNLIEDSHCQWEKVFKDDPNFNTSNILYFSQTSLAMDAAVSEQGIAIVPTLLAQEDISQGNLAVVWQDDRVNPNCYYVVYPKTESPKSEVRLIVVDWLIGEVVD